LASHPFDERFIRRFVKSTGINNDERMLSPMNRTVKAIPGYARLIVDEGMP
jgi:hypothetical protein